MLDRSDFGPNPHVPDYGLFGAVTVRWAKGTAGSGPRRRTVLTVPEFDWAVPMMQMWTSPGRRDRFTTADRSDALWPSERGHRVTLGTLGDSFAAAHDAVGLPKELGLHCLRHSYVTHLIEAGYDPTFVQTQVGHSYASTTSLYTSVSSDFKHKAIQQMIAAVSPSPRRARMAEQRHIGFNWNLRTMMAQRNLWKTTELMPLLRSRGINLSESQIYRLVTGRPERIPARTFAALLLCVAVFDFGGVFVGNDAGFCCEVLI